MIKRLFSTFTILLGLFASNIHMIGSQTAPPPPTPEVQGEQKAMTEPEKAVLEAATARRNQVEAVPFYDLTVDLQGYTQDQTWAAVWIIPTHPVTGEVIPTEPGLALAQWDGKDWQVLLPSDPGWITALENAPDGLMPEELRADLLLVNQPVGASMPLAPLGGYLLPWQGGRSIYLTRSTAHDEDIPSLNAHYAFDFSTAPSALFDIYASRSGTVWLFRDDVPNGTSSQVNYLVIQDTTTTPVTYHLYLHLAQNSIAPALKTIGAPVTQGQFIAIADDTGASTNHHLHFQVQTQPAPASYWSRSVDITFDDVDINGGRPRIPIDIAYCNQPGDVCTTTRSTYVSGNFGHADTNAPWGDISSPELGFSLSSSVVILAGWADDNIGLASIRMKVRYADNWHFVGPTFTASPFSYSWDACADQVPDGPVSVALEIRDSDGNYAPGLAGLKHFVKNYSCPPPPTCSPNSNQVAIFSGTDFSGSCTILGSGTHSGTALGAVGASNVESIKVGANVYSTVYLNSDASGRGETIASSDSSLSDNRIGLNALAAVKVQSRTSAPAVPRLVWPANNASFSASPSLSLAWDDAGGAIEFQVRLNGVLKPWQTQASLFLGSLSAGTYTWQVKGRNAAGESGWSSQQTFTVQTTNVPAATEDAAPVIYTWESGDAGWSNSSNWDQTLDQNHTAGGQVSWGYDVSSAITGYDNGLPNYGDLTSPQISIPAGGPYFLRFWYYYETEGPDLHWDQRWVQISVNGAVFTNLLQLSNDPPNIWLQSPAVDLSAHAGKSIQIRFHFETLDAYKNAFKGWYIDDFTIDTASPPACNASGEPDGTPAQARTLMVNGSLSGAICPSGEVDYYKFTVAAGDQIGLLTEAQTIGSPLDTYIDLLDIDGASILAANDDQALGTRTDSFLGFRFTRAGTYYVRVRPWNHPSAGGNDFTYNIKLFGGDSTRPAGFFTSPPDSTFLPNGLTNLSVTASDTGSGVSHVDFYWHSGDWIYSGWSWLSADWTSTDGWSAVLDTTSIPDQRDIAVFARVYDQTGNWFGTGAWNLWLDRTPPITALQPLPAQQGSTAFLLKWGSSDNVSGLDHFDIQRLVGSTWTDWQTGIDGAFSQTWFIGQAGQSYSFRMRGADRIGNLEAYPGSAEATTTIPSNVCTQGDEYESDNERVSATIVSGVSTLQTHSFCNPAVGSGGLNDIDWIRFSLSAGQVLSLQAAPIDPSAAPVMQLYAADGVTLLSQAAPAAFGDATHLNWKAAAGGQVFLKITHLDGRVAGEAVTYRLSAVQGDLIFLPLISK